MEKWSAHLHRDTARTCGASNRHRKAMCNSTKEQVDTSAPMLAAFKELRSRREEKPSCSLVLAVHQCNATVPAANGQDDCADEGRCKTANHSCQDLRTEAAPERRWHLAGGNACVAQATEIVVGMSNLHGGPNVRWHGLSTVQMVEGTSALVTA